MGWYMLSLNAVLVPGGVFSVLGYLLQASVLWLLCWHFVQNTLLSQHHCCLCPCFLHQKHIGKSLLPFMMSVCTSLWLQRLAAFVTHVGWLLLKFIYACSFITVHWQPVALVSCYVNCAGADHRCYRCSCADGSLLCGAAIPT